jgi:ABC-type nitrate/sulfonate/bicarbonate transport system substrate-binding protein
MDARLRVLRWCIPERWEVARHQHTCDMTLLKVGYVPEHFSTPLFFAKEQGFYKNHGVEVEFVPFPSGTGHMIQSLKDKSINVAIGLTEGFVAGIGKGSDWYKIVGTYVQSPLCKSSERLIFIRR